MDNDRAGGKGELYFAGALLRLRRVRELSRETLEYLASVVRDSREATKHRIAAGRVIVQHHEFRELRLDRRSDPVAIMREILGSDEKLLEFCESRAPLLRARLARQMTERSPDDGDAGLTPATIPDEA